MIRVIIKFKNSKTTLSFLIDDECKDIGNIISELIRDLGKTFADIESVRFRVLKS